ncbi:MAG: hypothetical protein AAB558_02445 [Patescibacteria group bacterium]
MPIIDIFILVLVCVVLLGLAWLSERIKDWLWSHVFTVFRFLFKTTLGCLGLCLVVGLSGGYLVSAWFSTPDQIVVAAAPGFPGWFRLVIFGTAAVTLCALCISAYRRLSPDKSEDDPWGLVSVAEPAPSSRPMPPPTFGRAPARELKEHDMDMDMDDIREPTPPRRPVGRARRPFVVVGLVVLALAGVGYWAWSNREPSDQQQLVTQAAQLQAEDTLRAVMKTDPVLSKSCPQGWDNDCWRILDVKIELPPCIKVTAEVGWWDSLWGNSGSSINTAQVAMDNQCRAETIRQNGRSVEAKAEAKSEEPWLDLEFYTDVQGHNQRKAFKAGDTVKIGLLLDDPALKREVILDFWHSRESVPWRILAHPSLTQGDLDGIYAEVQANGWYEAMTWLIINPNLDANVRGMWLMAPPLEAGEAGKTERERRVLLGLHQPNVPTGAVSYLVDQAVEEGQKGDLDLWKVLVKAAENGDLPAHRCRLSTDKAAEKDADKKNWPVCVKGQTWDFITQMKWYAEQEGSHFASVVADWEALKYKCQWEGSAGRHAGAVKNRVSKMTPKLADVSPANLPPEL